LPQVQQLRVADAGDRGRAGVRDFRLAGTACLDTKTGAKLWARTDFVCNHYRGAGSSPILWGDLLIMNFDGSDIQFVVALDKKTGKTVWETKRSVDFMDLDKEGKPIGEGDLRKAFATPIVIEQDGQPLLISSGAKAHYGYDPRTGKERWRFDEHAQHSASSRPIVADGMVLIQTGFSKGQLVALKLGGSGVLGEDQVAWRHKKGVANKPSVLVLGELLFMIDDSGIANCLEARTGTVLWTERVGGNVSASPVHVAGRIYTCNEEGKVAVLAPGREFKLLAENQFPDGFMASPAVSGQALYLRSKTHLYRVEE